MVRKNRWVRSGKRAQPYQGEETDVALNGEETRFLFFLTSEQRSY